MNPVWFFDNADAVVRLTNEALSWQGTPFAQWSKAKGVHGGIDCVGFVEAVMAAAGIEEFQFERAESDYSRHVHNSRVLDMLRGLHADPQSARLAVRFAELPVIEGDFVDTPMAGDLLILKDAGVRGHGVFHLPVMLAHRKFMHCARRLNVRQGNIDDPTYRHHLVAHFRARALA